MRIDWDVPIEMDDSLVLRADVYRPIEDGQYPVIMTYGPYAVFSVQLEWPRCTVNLRKSGSGGRSELDRRAGFTAHSSEPCAIEVVAGVDHFEQGREDEADRLIVSQLCRVDP